MANDDKKDAPEAAPLTDQEILDEVAAGPGERVPGLSLADLLRAAMNPERDNGTHDADDSHSDHTDPLVCFGHATNPEALKTLLGEHKLRAFAVILVDDRGVQITVNSGATNASNEEVNGNVAHLNTGADLIKLRLLRDYF